MHNFGDTGPAILPEGPPASRAIPALSRFSEGSARAIDSPMCCRASFPFFRPVFAVVVSLSLVASADEGHYTSKEPSRDGIGKVYMGREISHTVSSHAITWLERRDREGEERPSLVIENLDLKPTDVVADIGAGSGYFSFLLAPLVPQGKVIAQDIQQEMLDFVEGSKKLKKIANVEPLLGTIEDTRLPEGEVDLVIMVDAYHEFSHPREMMESIVKGLAPGGRVVFIEYRGEDPAVPIKPLHKMTVKQIAAEMGSVGLEFVEVRDFLPIQHFVVFRKPENKAPAP
jgi:SAM-dependent methyltransferase